MSVMRRYLGLFIIAACTGAALARNNKTAPSNATSAAASPAPAPASGGPFSSGLAFFHTIFGSGSDNAPKGPVRYLGDGLCLSGDVVTPFVLSDQYECPLHYYCPNVNISDPLSLPSMCPPTLECQIERLASQFCPAQGRYEPTVCERGYYCPNYLTQLPCPEGHFCPYGTVDPIPCTKPFSNCPVGTYKQSYYGSAIICVVIDAIMFIMYCIIRGRRLAQDRKNVREESRKHSGRKVAEIAETTHSKREANFVTWNQRLDSGSDCESTAPSKRSSVLSGRYWRKKAARVVNGAAVYIPASWQHRAPSRVPTAAAPVDELPSDYSVSPAATIVHASFDESQRSTPANTHSRTKSFSMSSSTTSSDHVVVPMPKVVPRPSRTGDTSVAGKRYSLHLNELLRGFRKAQNDCDLSLRFRFEDLSLTLPSGKHILNGVTGEIVPGKVTVIMGPSGAGKSTFMNVLMGKASRTGGRLLINDREVEMYRFKKIIGYVPQDDVMLRELSVRENIAYSAHTRLPRSWSQKEIESFVDAILDALDLSHVADSLIDSVSGGQRKRVNIGMELVTCPSAIFLDEPTSGLDSTAALKVANTMKKIAMSIGITIVAVIHQPRYEIFQEFDDLLMIAPGGVTAYLGPCDEAQQHFQNMGFYFDMRNNPADTLMDILSGKGRRASIGDIDTLTAHNGDLQHVASGVVDKLVQAQQTCEYDISDVVAVWRKRVTFILAKEVMNEPLSVLGGAYEPRPVSTLPPAPCDVIDDNCNDDPSSDESCNSRVPVVTDGALYSAMGECPTRHEAAQPATEVNLPLGEPQGSTARAEKRPSKLRRLSSQELDDQHATLHRACMERGASWVAQIVYAHNRSLKQQYRKVNSYVLEIIVAVVSGMVMGLAMIAFDGGLYQGLFVRPFTLISPAPVELVVPILALIIGCSVGLAGAPAGTKIFSEEREVYWREASAGHSPVAYFIGKNVSTLYRILVTSLHFSAFFHMFASPNVVFWHLYNIQLFQFFCVYGIAFIVAMIVKRENASMVAVCICIVFAVLSGNGPSIRSCREWGIEWLINSSFNRWAAEAWYSEETMVFDGVYEIWDVSAAHFGYTLNRFWMDIFWMFIIGLISRLIAFILLVTLNRQKQR